MSEYATDPASTPSSRRPAGIAIRPAVMSDVEALRRLMRAAIEVLQVAYLSSAQVRASHSFMGLDTQLIVDGGYFVAEAQDELLGCGGWSRRETLYGGDDSTVARAPRLLNAASEAARIRAMYTGPDWTRRGVAAAILSTCEAAAASAGFLRAELMSTLSGEAFYARFDYVRAEDVVEQVDGVEVPFIRMRKALAASEPQPHTIRPGV